MSAWRYPSDYSSGHRIHTMNANRRNRLGEYGKTASIKAILQICPPEWRRNVQRDRKNSRLLLTIAATAPRLSKVGSMRVSSIGESFKKKDEERRRNQQ